MDNGSNSSAKTLFFANDENLTYHKLLAWLEGE